MTLSSPDVSSQTALASKVASLLPALAPSAALENEVRNLLSPVELRMLTSHQPFRLALQEFIERGDNTFHDEITIWLRSRKRRKKTPNPSRLQQCAQKFFEDCKLEAGKSSRGTCPKDLLQGLVCLQEACKLSADDYRAMWDHSRRDTTSVELLGANRQSRAMEKENITESKSWAIESQRRLDLLHVEYEIRRLLPQSNKGGTNGGESEHAEREFSKLAEVDVRHTRAKRRNVRPYLYLTRYEHGLGLMLLLGVQTRKQ